MLTSTHIDVEQATVMVSIRMKTFLMKIRLFKLIVQLVLPMNIMKYPKIVSYQKKNRMVGNKEKKYEKLLREMGCQYKWERVMLPTGNKNKKTKGYGCKYQECRKKFKRVWNLIDHLRSHVSNKPYKCKY
jgi:hypothetical protein